jgi:hypothetical protein
VLEKFGGSCDSAICPGATSWASRRAERSILYAIAAIDDRPIRVIDIALRAFSGAFFAAQSNKIAQKRLASSCIWSGTVP